MFKKFILLTALFNFPIAIGMLLSVIQKPTVETFIITAVLSAFLIFAGLALLWAAKDIQTRAPIIVWNGLVRCIGFLSVAYATSLSLVPTILLLIAVMDVITALVYFIGCTKQTQQPFFSIVFAK